MPPAVPRAQRVFGALTHEQAGWDVPTRTGVVTAELAAFNVTDAVRAAIVASLRESGGEVSKALERALASEPPAARQRINAEVAEKARDSVLRSYDQRVTARETAASRNNAAYRHRPGRLGGGRLRRALGHPAMYRATAEGIDFINTAVLNKEAAHWRRLNFGVGRRGQAGRQGRFGMRMGGQVVAVLGLEGGPSRRAMFLPEGVFIGGQGERVPATMSRRGLDPFFASRARRGMSSGSGHPGVRVGSGRLPARRPTLGIEARNYLDAGVRRIADEFPRAHIEYTERLFRLAAERMGVAVVNVPVPAPRRPQIVTRPSTAERRFRRGQPTFL